MRRFIRTILICLALAYAGARAGSISEAELRVPPTPARLTTINAAARREGWSEQTAGLQAAARTAYQHDKLKAAAGWYYVYRWAALLGEVESDFVPHWIKAVQAASVAHMNMPVTYELRHRSMGSNVAPDLQAWLTSNASFSEGFFALLRPVDYVPRVLEILDEIYRSNQDEFKTHAQLALALAVVYDVPPPPDWPHAQVSPVVLRRRWPDALEAFNWWTREERLGHCYHPLTEMGADELKFVVDATAPFDELEWSQQVANYPLGKLARAYTMISYRRDRAMGREGAMWPGRTYTLPAILGAGGICVDQAYFATQVGKARGVPTLLFRGEGNDGRHAWFGFLNKNGKWQLDAGRYAAQRFVTGYARDPQTWRVISDHELKFLAERFRTRPSFREARLHADFAADYLADGDAPAAERAARKAVQAEPRAARGWEILLAAESAAGGVATRREATLREAVEAFQSYPDLEAVYSKHLSDMLRARGQTAAADAEQRRIARKYQGDRSDLSLRQARDILLRSIATQSVEQQMQAYETTIDRFGRGAGIAFYDQIVLVFVNHLLDLGKKPEAMRAASRARDALKVEPGRQLDQEFSAMLKQLRAMR